MDGISMSPVSLVFFGCQQNRAASRGRHCRRARRRLELLGLNSLLSQAWKRGLPRGKGLRLGLGIHWNSSVQHHLAILIPRCRSRGHRRSWLAAWEWAQSFSRLWSGDVFFAASIQGANTVRLYNVNPQNNHSKFMEKATVCGFHPLVN